jgi:transposase
MVKCSKDQVERLEKALSREKDPVVRQRIQMILLREDGKTQEEIAALMGVSLSTVNRAHMAYDHGGRAALRPKPTGGRRRENMTLDEEEKFLNQFAKAAGAGELLNIHVIKAAYEEAIGHPTSNSTIYGLLERHDWRKLMPRPCHPKCDPEAQEAFKNKGFAKAVRKARRLAAAQGRPLRIMFADEARFGRMNRPRPCWAPGGVRPRVACQLVREFVYLYGAVCPRDGTCAFLILPAADTECFQIFLDMIAKKYRRSHVLIILDGAGNHRCDDLIVPDNITLQELPPYSPELNPQENIWDEIREKIFKNYALKSMDEVMDKLDDAALYIENNPKVVRSISSFPYIVNAT